MAEFEVTKCVGSRSGFEAERRPCFSQSRYSAAARTATGHHPVAGKETDNGTCNRSDLFRIWRFDGCLGRNKPLSGVTKSAGAKASAFFPQYVQTRQLVPLAGLFVH